MKKPYSLLNSILTVLFISFSINFACAQHCISSFGDPTQFHINRVQLNTINNSSTYISTSNSYSDFTAISTDLQIGQTYNLTIHNEITNSWDEAGYGVWIDYNNDGDFDDSNETIWTSNTSNISPQNTSFTVPLTATLGNLRLRINMVSWWNNPPACVTSSNNGETEDYIVNLIPPPNPFPQDDDISVLVNSTSNQINVGTNDIIGTDGGDLDDFTIQTSPGNGTVTEVSDGIFAYTPNTNYLGSDSFTYNICDTNGDCSTATVNISVTYGQCTPTSNSNGTNYITNVNLVGETTLNNTSGDNGGYQDFSPTVAALDLFPNETYTASISVMGSNMGWDIYIDYNHDGDFTDTDEKVADTAGESTGNLTFTVPAGVTTGKTIMRVGARKYWASTAPCGNLYSQPEEFEDYLIDIKVDPSTLDPNALINVSGNGNEILNGALSSSISNDTNFSSVDTYGTTKTKTFTITNNGLSNLVLNGSPIVNFTIASTEFTVSQQPLTTSLAYGESTTFTISFNPTSIGIKQATITISNNDTDQNPYTFLIEGEGTQTFPDTDGDGVPDNIDEDDDNDGLLDSFEDSSCKTFPNTSVSKIVFLNENFGAGTNRILINGNFNGASSTYCYEDGTGSLCTGDSGSPDLNNGEYTVYYNAGIDVASYSPFFWYQGGDHTGNTNGRMAIFNADENPGTFYEAEIYGVKPNIDITYGFAAINLDAVNNGVKPEILMEILDPNGNVISSTLSGPLPTTGPSGDWVQVETTFNTTYTQFTVKLSNAQAGGNGNDLAIDDIYVVQYFCDFDGDGIADTIDLDNDNDGIPNVVELGLLDTDKDATLLGTGWIDANSNGVHDSYESGAATIDSDGDNIPDYIDLDSDNDGIFDTVEYDGYGDVDISGNGFGNGTDISSGIDNDDLDGDGILSIIDNNDTDADGNDHGSSAYNTPLDSDGDTIPDYLDIHNDITGIDDIDTTIYTSYDANNDGIIDGNTDIDLDGILDTFDTDTNTYGSPRDLDDKYTLFFDGRNDYVEDSSVIDGWANGTIMAWIKIAAGATGDRYIIGQDNFYLMINNGGNLTALANGTTLTSSATLSTNIWIHVAASYNSTTGAFSLYLNGEEINTVGISGSLPSDTSSLTIGRTPDTDSNYFEGDIDEVRIFNESLSEGEIQKMVYQELDENQNFNQGKIIPKDISTSLNSSLIRYFKMDSYKDDILDNKTTTAIDEGTGAKIYNIKDIYYQTAPLPYETTKDGDWSNQSSWLHGDVWDIHNESTNKDWSIVNIKNNITTSNTHTTLGLIIDSSKKLEINNDVELKNTWYISLNGEIDLQGESQLVQTQNSLLVANGTLERDQQGTENLYTYNYWSSPVHTSNPNSSIDGDETYTIASVLKNGDDPLNPNSISFISGYNGNNTTNPIQISDYWIWKFDNRLTDTYSEWQQVKSTGTMLVGEGYTMKGPGTGSVTTEKNYVFKGTPNNGEISLTINAGNDYLIGNPYPSAIDGAEFLNDNPHLNGTLYFWEHYGGGSHILAEYQGGYGLYNFSGGTPPIDGNKATPDSDVSQSGIAIKIPKRYIPVGQGFFVTATTTGDTKFENDQRVFVTEAGNTNSIFLKNSNKKESKTSTSNLEDLRPKIKIKYKSPKGYIRQLLTTVDKKATIGYDWGYDGLLIEDNTEDMYWKIMNNNYIIQGIDTITDTTTLPISVKTKEGGLIEISIASLENVADDVKLYLKDNDTFHDLRASNYITTAKSGITNDRFEIVFTKKILSVTDVISQDFFTLFYNKSNASLTIDNLKNKQLQCISAINMLGQKVFEKELNTIERHITIPINITTGVYVFIIKTNTFSESKNMIITH
ncbi:GEVED domain-containing protein [Thalassobellus citreus]|uniref:GEVED domain-containing protein n=1 Tax=Thalassobellus citreus TaxID=3367752 RepID=UPI0037A86727